MEGNFYPDFKLELTLKELLNLDVYGVKYMNAFLRGFPQDWFENAKLSIGRHDPSPDFFGVDALQSL